MPGGGPALLDLDAEVERGEETVENPTIPTRHWLTVEEKLALVTEHSEQVDAIQGASGLLDEDAAIVASSLLAPEWAGYADPTISKALFDEDGVGPSRSAPLLSTTPDPEAKPAPKCCVWSELLSSEDWLSCWTGCSMAFFCFACALSNVEANAFSMSVWGVKDPPQRVHANLLPLLLAPFFMMALISSKHVDKTLAGIQKYLSSMLSTIIPGAIISCFVGNYEHLKNNGMNAALWSVLLPFGLGNFLEYCCGECGQQVLKLATPGCKKGEFYIKVGLVLLATDLSKIAELGEQGFLLAWSKPVLMTTLAYYVISRYLESTTMSVLLAAGLSICGTSAISAAAGAVQAPSDELTAAVAVCTLGTLAFQLITPYLCIALGLDDTDEEQEIAGAWIGSTVDNTGNVVVAANIIGEKATETGGIVKMMQNMSMSYISFGLAVWWIRRGGNSGELSTGSTGLPYHILWKRFPKFVIGYVGLSVLITLGVSVSGDEDAGDRLQGLMRGMGEWSFLMGFVGIGFSSNVRKLLKTLGGGRGVRLIVYMYLLGQIIDTIVGGVMSYLIFTYV